MGSWFCIYRAAKYIPADIEAESVDELVWKMQHIADQRGLGKLRVEDFTDEVHFFYRRSRNRWVRFCNAQLEDSIT